MKNKYFLSIIPTFLLLLIGCLILPLSSQPTNQNDIPLGISSSEAECVINTDCETPMEYMIQSRCPFGSACINNKCEVVCGLYYHDPNPEISKSYPTSCMTNEDCDCSDYLADDLKSCACIDQQCLVVIDQSKSTQTTANEEAEENLIYEPIAEFKERITKKPFGIYITPSTSPVQPEKFSGYHTGVDVEYDDVGGDIAVRAIADGKVIASQTINGYGGVLIIKHKLDGQDVLALYGHLDINSAVVNGTEVTAGQKIAILGDGYTDETDGERKHLHFGIINGTTINYKGYVNTESELSGWVDPLNYY